MMQNLYVHVDNLNLVCTKDVMLSIMRRNNISPPNILDDAVLSMFGWFNVNMSNIPFSYEKGSKYFITAELVDNEYIGILNKIPLSEAEIEDFKNKMREIRNKILRDDIDSINIMKWETFTKSEKEKWKEYRQNLLDITTQPGFPFDIKWPVKPT